MHGRPVAFQHPAPSGASAFNRGRGFLNATAPTLSALPSELAFWALWHCRHARPPDSCASR
ncbi:hypothetical protein C9I50_10665 [Pseudomonas prosekii]|uniref:Uncharacterized protein n=1 Tax=Pseudomonas prosekii TaxID=1148509 RepID=A0A2U2D8B6_9PSED|nr:hypothetical protein C9I50_10665 [Pseudomonas prosekii]PWE44786.1 hypothetical protein C9I49_12575 [Pseudomonas prosekii]